MRRSELEQRVLDLWISTRVPLTRVNLQVLTRVPRSKLEPWLDELVGEGILEVDSDDDGEMLWVVPGAERSKTGLQSVAEVKKLNELRGSIDARSKAKSGSNMLGSASTALVRRAVGQSLAARGPEQKSVVAAGALGFFLGPIGWLYAAPLKDAIPAIIIMSLAFSILPHFLLIPLLGVLMPASALASAFYAWQHNSKGERVSLRDVGKDEK
jgi:hypothetical protein